MKGRADGKGTGPETVEDIKPDGTKELVHTFGWYMAQFVSDAKAKGVTAILCSPIPHKQNWETHRDFENVAKWDEEVAKANGALFFDLTLIISDGYENTSATTVSRVVKTREQSEALVYAFGLAGPTELAPGGGYLTNVLPAVVGDSGGVYLSITSLSDAAAAGLTLLHEFKYQYTLAYTPSKPLDGTYRRIKVEIAVPDLLVRHRGGYLALPAGAKP